MRTMVLTTVRRVAIVFLLANSAVIALGQEEEVKYRNTVTAGVAVNEVISESGDQISMALGFDYLYRLNPKWEVGFQLDLNYSRIVRRLS